MSASRISKEEMKQKINDLFELLTELNRVFDSFNRKDTEFFFRARKDELALFSDMLGQWALGLSELKAAFPFEGVQSKRLAELVDYLDELKSQLQIAVSVLSQVTDAITVNLEKDIIVTDIAIVIKNGSKSHDVTFVDFLRKLKQHAEKLQQIMEADNFKGLTVETRSSQAFTQAGYKLKLSVKHSPVDRLKELPPEIMEVLVEHIPLEVMHKMTATSSDYASIFRKSEKVNYRNPWETKLLTLGIKRRVLDRFVRIFNKFNLEVDYRQLAASYDRLVNCVVEGRLKPYLLNLSDPQMQLQALFICSNNPAVLDLSLIDSTPSQYSLFVCAVAARANRLVSLRIPKGYAVGYAALESLLNVFGGKEFWEDISRAEEEIISLQKFDRLLESSRLKSTSENLVHLVKSYPRLIEMRNMRDAFLTVIKSKVRAILRMKDKEAANSRAVNGNRSHNDIVEKIIETAQHHLQCLYLRLGSEAFSRLDSLTDSTFMDGFARFLVESRPQDGPRVIPADILSVRVSPDDVNETVYRFLHHCMGGNSKAFKHYISTEVTEGKGVQFRLKTPEELWKAFGPLGLDENTLQELLSKIISWSPNAVIMQQLIEYFDLKKLIYTDRYNYGDNVMRDNLLQSWPRWIKTFERDYLDVFSRENAYDLVSKLIMWERFKIENKDSFHQRNDLFDAIGIGVNDVQTRLSSRKGDYGRSAHVLAPWRMKTDSLKEMFELAMDQYWSPAKYCEFIWRLAQEAYYAEAAYFLKLTMRSPKWDAKLFEGFLVKKLQAVNDNSVDYDSLFTAIDTVCSRLYEPSRGLVETLWQYQPLIACNLALQLPELQVPLLLHFPESVVQALQASHSQNSKLQMLIAFGLGMQKLVAQQVDTGIEHFKTAYAHDPEMFLNQIQLILEKSDLYGLDEKQLKAVKKYLANLIDGIDGNPDNSIMLQCEIDEVKEVVLGIKPEQSERQAPKL